METISASTTSAVTPRNSRSYILALPPELLLIIFKFVYVTAQYSTFPFAPCFEVTCRAQRRCFCNIESHQERDWENDEDPPRTLFPNSVASVCSSWRKLMLLVPTFWTRIVILLDTDNFPPPDLELQLSLSKDCFLDIIVSRNSFSNAIGLEIEEKSRMIHVFGVLGPHLHRCQVLRIDAVHSSSLPRILAVLPPVMPQLYGLLLETRIDSGPPEVQLYTVAEQDTLFDWSYLETVAIDGWNRFSILRTRNLTELDTHVPASAEPILSGCSKLLVRFGTEGLSPSILQKMSESANIRDLEIDSITFVRGQDINPEVITPPNLTLTNLSAEDTSLMLRLTDLMEVLTINNCPSSSITQMPRADMLVLRNISSSQDIEVFLRLWRGVELWVIGCTGFDDNALRAINAPSDGNHLESSRSSTTNMIGLFIQDCHGFSANALKELVEAYGGALQDSKTSTTLHIIDSRSTSPVQEELKWFEQKFYSFMWNG